MGSNKNIIVLGSGPGIGVATASHFAAQGFNIALVSRNAQRLQDDAAKVSKAATQGVKVKTFSCSTGDHVALKKTLEQIHSELGDPEVVFVNAARVGFSEFGKFTPDELVDDFKTVNVGTYVAAQWSLPLLEKAAGKSHPSFFVSAGGLHDHPLHPFFSLSMVKAAQYNLLNSFSQIAGPKGIHVANVNIGGEVKDEDPVINAKNIAAQLWTLYGQDQAAWQKQIDVGNIEDMIKNM